MATQRTRWLQVLKPISPRANLIIGCLSFVVPILIWSLVSYVPWIWHPQVFITNPGSVDYLQAGMRMDKAAFADAVAEAKGEKREPPQGVPANPIYLPAPHEVATALYTSFTTPPATQDGNWLHQSLWHSGQFLPQTSCFPEELASPRSYYFSNTPRVRTHNTQRSVKLK